MLVTDLFMVGEVFCLLVNYLQQGSNSSLPTFVHSYLDYIGPSTKELILQ